MSRLCYEQSRGGRNTSWDYVKELKGRVVLSWMKVIESGQGEVELRILDPDVRGKIYRTTWM